MIRVARFSARTPSANEIFFGQSLAQAHQSGW